MCIFPEMQALANKLSFSFYRFQGPDHQNSNSYHDTHQIIFAFLFLPYILSIYFGHYKSPFSLTLFEPNTLSLQHLDVAYQAAFVCSTLCMPHHDNVIWHLDKHGHGVFINIMDPMRTWTNDCKNPLSWNYSHVDVNIWCCIFLCGALKFIFF